jgi:hypothetical protein
MQFLGGLLEAAFLRHEPEIPQVMIIQLFHTIYIIRLNLRVNEELRIGGRCATDRCSHNETFAAGWSRVGQTKAAAEKRNNEQCNIRTK